MAKDSGLPNSHLVRVIKKSRIVSSILSELGASKATVFLDIEGREGTVQSQMSCELAVPFSESELRLLDAPNDVNTVTAICCFASHRIQFTTSRKSGSSELWALPSEIKMIDLRQERRWKFPESQYSCEIVGESLAVYGYAVDLNKDCIAVDLDTTHSLTIGSKYKLIARMVNTNQDVFFVNSKLLLLTGNDSEGVRAIFRTDDKASQGDMEKKRSSKRFDVSSASVVLSGSPFSDFKSELDFEVENISSGGLLLRLREGNADYGLVPGMILRAKHPEVSLIVIWENDGYFGCRPLLQGRDALSYWYRFLEEVNPPKDRKVSTSRREFADLLTYSGLVKGERRLPYGQDMSDHLITHPELVSPLLIQRHYATIKTSDADMHVSAKRISDTSWFFGDGAALTEDLGHYNEMLDECTNRLTKLANDSFLFPRYLTGIWHENIKSTAKWGINLAKSPTTKLFKSINVSMKKFRTDPNGALVQDISHLSASLRSDISSQFDSALFEAFAGSDGTHPILNTELCRFGPYHRAESKIAALSNNLYLVAHRTVTYGIWSNSGVTNSVYVMVPKNCDEKSLMAGLRSLAQDELSFGTDDFLVIFDESYSDTLDEKIFPLNRYYTFIVHDLRLQAADSLKPL